MGRSFQDGWPVGERAPSLSVVLLAVPTGGGATSTSSPPGREWPLLSSSPLDGQPFSTFETTAKWFTIGTGSIIGEEFYLTHADFTADFMTSRQDFMKIIVKIIHLELNLQSYL